MMKKSLIASIFWFVVVCFGVTSQAGVILNVSLTNINNSATEVTFDIEATFSSLDGNGDPQLDDFVSSLSFGLDRSSAGLISMGPIPYDRFSVETTGYPWDGAVDDVNGLLDLTARSSGFDPDPHSDYLVHNTPLIIARLHLSTVGLANDDYLVSLNSAINLGQGTLDGVDNEVTDRISIKDVTFTVVGNQTVPEPSSIAILGLGVAAVLMGRRRSA
jgi:hypothetical protein